MRHAPRILSVSAVVVCATLRLGAQNPPVQTWVDLPELKEWKITTTGCLQPDHAAKHQTGGSDTKYVLLKATRDGNPSKVTGGKIHPGSQTSPMANTYRLEGSDSTLSPHLGHKVQISGTLEGWALKVNTPENLGGPPRVRNTAAVTVSPYQNLHLRKLKVESVKMVARSCDPGSTFQTELFQLK